MVQDDNSHLYILITNSLQNDFCEPIPAELLSQKQGKVTLQDLQEYYGHQVHINQSETTRLWENNKLEAFLNRICDKIGAVYSNNVRQEFYKFIHIRDLHCNINEDQLTELGAFGDHCIEGTRGVQFIEPIEKLINNRRFRGYSLIVNSNNINSFVGTHLKQEMRN